MFSHIRSLIVKKGGLSLNILLGILKYPPDYAGDGLRFHRMFKRLKRVDEIDQVHVVTSWDHRQKNSSSYDILDGIHIHRTIENTGKKKYEARNRFLKKLAMPLNFIRVGICYFSLYASMDVVLTSGSGWLPSSIAWLAFLTRKPLIKEIVLLKGDDPLTLNQRSAAIRWFFTLPFSFAQLIITISPPLEKACLDFGIPPEKIWCRLNPVDFPSFHSKKDYRTHSRIPASTVPTILWVGTIKPRKNVHFLLQAAHFLNPPVRLIFIGPHEDDAYYAKVLEISRTLPQDVEVIFAGVVEDQDELMSIYKEANLFWFASHKEGMGNAVAEALISGTPVVTLPVMGIMNYVIPTSEDGEVVSEENPEKFAAVANKWLKSRSDRCAIAKRAAERFNAEKVDAAYSAWFQKVVAVNAQLGTNEIKAIPMHAAV